jgi:hypothetical protein
MQSIIKRTGFTLLMTAVLFAGCRNIATGGQQRATASINADQVSFSTYMGGSGEDSIRDVATDSQGNTYVAGGTASANFPTTRSAYDTSFNGTHDVFVAKLDGVGSLVWSTFIGGPNYDRAYAIEVDKDGFVYIAGRAGPGYPTTSGTVQPNFGGDVKPNDLYGQQDGFVTKLSPDGSQIVWSTYFGSDDKEIIRDIALDDAGNIHLATTAVTRTHPHITPGAFQTDRRGPSDGVVAKLSSDGRSVIYASYFGGTGDDGEVPSIRADQAGNSYYLTLTQSTDAPVTPNAYQRSRGGARGQDLILAKISTDGARLIYSTYFGGSDDDGLETHSLAIDAQGNAFLGFTTRSLDLPTNAESMQKSYAGSGGSGTGAGTNYSGDGFVAKLSADGSRLVASSYVGGRFGEGIEGIQVDAQGRVYVSGATYSDNFPISADAAQAQKAGKGEVFVVVLKPDLSGVVYGTYLGGREDDFGRTMAIDARGDIYVGGMSKSSNWPTNKALQSTFGGNWDAVLAKITLAAGIPLLLPRITSASVSGKKLIVIGENFAAGAEIILNDKNQKTINDPAGPATRLVAKKAGKKIAVGDNVRLQARNPDGTLSEVFNFTRPSNSN